MADQRHRRPTVEDVDPSVMAVDATPDELRTHGDADETETAQLTDGSVIPVEQAERDTEEEDQDGR